MTKLNYALVKAGRDASFAVKKLGAGTLNLLKKVPNLFAEEPLAKSRVNPVSEDFSKTAFDIAKEINNLSPFDAKKVVAADCPLDVITQIETSISSRKSPKFFTADTREMDETYNALMMRV